MRRLCLLSLGFVLLFAAPGAPQHVSAQLAHGGITVAWDAVPQAVSYRVYRGTRSHGEGTTPYAGNITSLFFVNTHVNKGVRYYYQVTAVGPGGAESARSAEVSSIIGAPVPAPKPRPSPTAASHSGINWGALLAISLLLLLGAGIAFLVWQRGTVAHVTAQLRAMPARRDHPSAPLMPPADTLGAVANFPSSPYDDIAPPRPPEVALPGSVFPGEGLVSRFGAATPPVSSVPTGALADPEPLNEIFGDGNTTFSSSSTISSQPLLPNHMRQLDRDAAPWPVAGGIPRPPIDQPNDTRTLLFIIAGALIAVGFLSFIVYAYFASSGGNGTTITGHPAPVGTAATTAPQPTATAAPSPSPVAVAPGIAIAAGGPGAGNFVADTDVSGGNTDTTHDHIDRSNVIDPAPEKVYQSERWGDSFTYTIPNLTAGAQYRVRLHFAEIYFKQPGQRLFNVAINGQPVLHEFDIVAEAGGPDVAIVKEFMTTADANGQITILFTDGSQNHPKISGIEIIAAP